ncbi:MAG TPA: hypothetical protein VF134_00680 [Candidatus Dormibacteraeota bacterium]
MALLTILASVEFSVWAAEAAAARSAALAGARAATTAGGTAAVAQSVAVSALRPSLVGAPVRGWCPGGAPPPGVWVCAVDRGSAIEVRVGGSVPALVPLLPGRGGLPLQADVTLPREAFR